MGYIEFLSRLIDAIAWPATVFLIIFLFRQQLANILPFLERLKYKDFEMVFRRRLESVKPEIPFKVLSPEENSKFKQIAKRSPKAAVLEAWSGIEDTAATKVDDLFGGEQWRESFHGDAVSFLLYKRALIPSTSRALQEMWMLRNQIVPLDDFAISEENAVQYAIVAESIKTQIANLAGLPKFHLTPLTYLIFEINHLIDTGRYQHISVSDMKKEIKNGTVLQYLSEKAGRDIDLSLFLKADTYPGFIRYYSEELQRTNDVYGGDERRRWGVENSGLCLLIAWTNQIIQQGAGWHPSE